MNTHDIDIELPPLPTSFVLGYAQGTIEDIENYARAAIAADRQRQGDAAKVLAELVALIPLADTLNASASCQDLIDYFKGVIADRKRRGEPVGYRWRDGNEDTWKYVDGLPPEDSIGHYEVELLYAHAANKPAEQSNQFRKCRHCGWDCKPSAEDRGWHPLEQSAEPVRVPSEELMELMLQFSDGFDIPSYRFAEAARALLARYGKGTP